MKRTGNIVMNANMNVSIVRWLAQVTFIQEHTVGCVPVITLNVNNKMIAYLSTYS